MTARSRVSMVVVLLALVLLVPGRALATDVSGTIASSTSWTAAGSPYVLVNDVTVAAAATLTIDPGVEVRIGALRRLTVDGRLSAVGTAGQPITFTAVGDPAPTSDVLSTALAGSWYAIFLQGGASELAFARVRYGGWGSGANYAQIVATAGSHTIRDSIVEGGACSGIRVSGGATVAVLRTRVAGNDPTGSSCGTNAGNGVTVTDGTVSVVDSRLEDNGRNGIEFTLTTTFAGAASAVNHNQIWLNRGFGVVITIAAAAGKAPSGTTNNIYDNRLGATANPGRQMEIDQARQEAVWVGNWWGDTVLGGCPASRCTQTPIKTSLRYEVPTDYLALAFAALAGPVYATPVSSIEDRWQTATWPICPDSVPSGEAPVVWEHGETCHNNGLSVSWQYGIGSKVPVVPAGQKEDIPGGEEPPWIGGVTEGELRGCPCAANPAIVARLDEPRDRPYSLVGDPVNTSTGALSEGVIDLQMPGPGIPFVLSRTYTSRDTDGGVLGRGWSYPFEAALSTDTSGNVRVRGGDGAVTRFDRRADGSYATDVASALTRKADGTFRLVSQDQREQVFDSAGRLVSMRPRNLPAMSFSYSSGQLTGITDSAGRAIALTYWPSGRLRRVSLPDGRFVEYTYDPSDRLSTVRDAAGKTWTYGYDAGGFLATITDPTAHAILQATYDATGRVLSQTDGAGATTSWAYPAALDEEGRTLVERTVPGRGMWTYANYGLVGAAVRPPGLAESRRAQGAIGVNIEADALGNTSRYDHDARGNTTRITNAKNEAVARTFTATNDLLTETDARNHTTTYTYCTLPAGCSANGTTYLEGQLQSVQDRAGGTRVYRYVVSGGGTPASTVGLVASISDERGKTTSYTYTAQGLLQDVTTPLGFKTSYSYDATGRMLTRRDPRGNAVVPAAGYLTTWTYDDADRVLSERGPGTTDVNGVLVTSTYYDNGLLATTSVTDTGGATRTTTREYDGADRLWKLTDPRGQLETRTYWPDGAIKRLEQPLGATPGGAVTTYDYDAAGRLTSVVEPRGNAPGASAADYTWTYTYDAAGNRLSESHPDAGTTTIGYDPLNRATSRTRQLASPADTATSSVSFDANGNVATRVDGRGKTRSYGYDNLDRVTSETDERAKTTTYEYWETGQRKSVKYPDTSTPNKTWWCLDDDGRVVKMIDPRGGYDCTSATSTHTWTYQYDQAANRTRVTDPLGNYTAYTYTPFDAVASVRDPNNNTTSYAYDALNRLASVTPPAAGATGTLATSYTYDASGNLATRSDPKTNQTSWMWGLDGRLLQRQTPVGTWKYTYDPNGNLAALETARGVATPAVGDFTISYGYDHADHQTLVDYSDTTPDVTRGYDLAGRVVSMSDGAGALAYTWDKADRLSDITRTGAAVAALNGTLHYDYDDAANITGRTYPDTTAQTATYDDNGRVKTITSAGATTTLAYDAAGNLLSETLPATNGHVATRSYDTAGRPATLENKKGTTTLSKFTWTLDAAGNPLREQTLRGTTTTYDRYEYDARLRIAKACYSVASTATSCSGATNAITYTYDKNNNRATEVRAGSVGNTGTITSTYNAADQLTQTVKGATTTLFAYDANGNRSGDGTRTYTYDLADRPTSTTAGAATTSYAYDGDNNRIQSTTSSGTDLRYWWDPLAATGTPELILERTPTGTLTRRYINGPTGPISQTTSTATSYYHRGWLDSISDVTASAGTAQWAYTYEPYGAPRTTTPTGTPPENRIRFTGQYLDPETSLYNLRARAYDPARGRFDALDPLDSPPDRPYTSSYAYAAARPTTLIDPAGTAEWPWQWGDDISRGIDGVALLDNGAIGRRPSTSITDPLGVRPESRYSPQQRRAANTARPYYTALTWANPSAATARECGRIFAGTGGVLPAAACAAGLVGAAADASLAATGGQAIGRLCRIGKGAQDAAAEEVGGAASVRLGQAGEAAVREAYDIGPKATRTINGRTRIFDGLNGEAVSEVKNVGYLSYTQQLRDYAAYAADARLRLDIYVRPGTRISGPLARADLDPASPVNIIRGIR